MKKLIGALVMTLLLIGTFLPLTACADDNNCIPLHGDDPLLPPPPPQTPPPPPPPPPGP